MGCGCTSTKGPDGGPTAFVDLTYPGSRKNGVKGMIALIKLGDRHTDEDIKHHRCVCRECPYLAHEGNRPVCGRDRYALHWLTAVGSFMCPRWIRRRSKDHRAPLESTATPG